MKREEVSIVAETMRMNSRGDAYLRGMRVEAGTQRDDKSAQK